MESNDALEKSYVKNTPHVRQRYTWDCGIACVIMVLPDEDKKYFMSNFTTICQNEEINKSTWTIDLCYLLKRFNVKHCLYTKKIGISSQHFSSIKITEKDLHRVRKRLKEATSCGLRIIEKVLSTEDLLDYVRSRGPAIVLVNARILVCDWCKRNKLTSELRSIWGGPYRGHYITLVSRTRDKILYRDPASHHHTCATTARRLDAARNTPGTDHDVIFVNI